MSRIAARFAQLRAEGRGALIPYLEAFDPDLATSSAILRGRTDNLSGRGDKDVPTVAAHLGADL